MKKSINIVLVLLVFIAGCQKENVLDASFEPAKALLAPEDNAQVEIDFDQATPVTFQWEEGKAADGSLVLYEVLFDEEGGDFSDPVYKTLSDQNGADARLTMTPSDLNKLAIEAGIQPAGNKVLKWTVLSSRGGTSQQLEGFYSFSLAKPEGIGQIPEQLYMSGDATEAGASADTPIRFKKKAPGVFEVITSLGDGDIIVSNTADPAQGVQYYVGDDQKLTEGNQTTSISGGGNVYRIDLDFNARKLTLTAFTKVELYIPMNGETVAQLDYVGDHKFEATNVVFGFLQPGDVAGLTWEEERYRFRIITDSGTEYYGSYLNDNMTASLIEGIMPYNVRPNGDEPEGYYNVYNVTNTPGQNADWVGCYKFGDAYNGNPFDVVIDFEPVDGYTHTLIPH